MKKYMVVVYDSTTDSSSAYFTDYYSKASDHMFTASCALGLYTELYERQPTYDADNPDMFIGNEYIMTECR